MIDMACDLFHKGWIIVSLATPIMNMSSSVLVGGSENRSFHRFVSFFYLDHKFKRIAENVLYIVEKWISITKPALFPSIQCLCYWCTVSSVPK